MNLPYYAIKRRVTTVMVFAGIFFLGAVALIGYPQELFPRINFPQITVVTDYVNAAPEEIETLITRPLEEAISSVGGLRRVESISREGKSIITVSFNWNQNLDFAALAVREKIDLVKERLPKESEDPVVLKFDPLSRPIMILSLTGNLAPVELKRIAQYVLQDNLEKVPGVASVSISGGLDREIMVELDQGRMQAAGVSILEAIDAIDKANISYPAGSIKKGLYEYLIRTVGSFRSVEEIGYTVVNTESRRKLANVERGFIESSAEEMRASLDSKRQDAEKGITEKRLVLLRDIADIYDTFGERNTVSKYNGKENVSLAIQKQASANAVDLVEQIRRELWFLSGEVEGLGAHAEIVYDHSEFIKKAVNNTRDAALFGALLAGLILIFFFREWGSAAIVAFSIPISIVGSFFLMKMQGITMNTMSLGGLALGAGMIVDNSIVVIENIFRLREEGVASEEASVRGANEVFWPIVSSTLTTEAVFLPLIIFVPGIAGQLFRDLSWAVIHCLNISFLISIWLIPMAALYVKPRTKKGRQHERLQKTTAYFQAMSPRKQNIFCGTIVLAGLGAFLLSILIFNLLDTEVIPKVDQGQMMIRVNLPVGSTIEATEAVVKKIESELTKIDEVENVAVTIGSAPGGRVGEVSVDPLRRSQAIVLVTLKKDRKRPSHAVLRDLQEKLSLEDLKNTDLEYILQENEFEFAATGGKPIVVEIKGYDLDLLQSYAREVEEKLKDISGVSEILDDIGDPTPETKIEIDKKKAALYAISARDVSLTAKAAIDGAIATDYKEAGREFDVRVRLKESDREDLDKLSNLLLYSDTLRISIPMKAIAALKPGFGPSEIKRKDQIRTVVVTAAIRKGFQEKEVLRDAAAVLSAIEYPNTYEIKLVGKAQEVKESFRRVLFAIILALILNYMIMAAQFESFIQPFIVMFTVPLAMIGVALALLITQTAVSIISLLGVLILAGTVVNNAIVLIDFINQRRIEGIDTVQAAIESAFIRFRPIMMTAITTMVGLIPLALGIGEGAELQAPLAISVIGGLITATIFTLYVIPTVYILMVRISDAMIGMPDVESF